MIYQRGAIARGERESITAVWDSGVEPAAGPGQKPLLEVRSQVGKPPRPLKLIS